MQTRHTQDTHAQTLMLTYRRTFTIFLLSFTYFANTLFSSWQAIPHPPTQLNASCPTIPTQPPNTVSVSKRQLDSKCHPVLCQRRTRTRPAGRDRRDDSQNHCPRKTLETWMPVYKAFRRGIYNLWILPADQEVCHGTRGVFNISLWPKLTLKVKRYKTNHAFRVICLHLDFPH